VPWPSIVVDNPSALLNLVQRAPQFHDYIMRDRSRIFNNILCFF
jgi:hypothetical protein